MMLLGIAHQVNGPGNEKAKETQGHEDQCEVEPHVVVQANGVANKGAVMIKHQDATTGDATMFGTQGTSNMTGMT
jgi:hypothetical protein